ncbi:hypothetical protein BH23BAC1_BH23BAC1_09940 [soil metagenome]
MSGKNIFISYRRQDAAGEAGRLADSLKHYFNDDQIFMDVETIEPGVDFVEVISKAVSSCDVLLAVIGPRWLSIAHSDGKRRLDDPDDFIRLEIATALKRNIRVVPVLVNDASMPSADQLPEELASLVRRQAHEISNSRWKYDTDQLIATLEKILGVRKPTNIKQPEVKPQKSWLAKNYKWVAGIFIFLLLISTLFPEEVPLDPEPIYYPTNDQDEIVQDDPVNIYNDEPVSNRSTVQITPKTNDETPKEQPIARKTEAFKNVDGVWFGMNLEGGTYYFVIEQDNNKLKYIEYDINDQQTGSGAGSIKNNDITLNYISNYGVTANVKLKVSVDGEQLEGTITEQSFGLSIPMSLSKFDF